MEYKFLFLGDSLISGYGVGKSKCWVTNLPESTLIYNAGINGNTTADMLYRVSDEIISSNATNVFLMGGTNDLLLNRSISHILDNIVLLIDEFKKNNFNIQLGIPPYIVSEMAKKLFMPSMSYDYAKSKLPILREELIKLCHKENIKFIDFYILTKENIKEDIYIDGIHLNEKGHQLMCSYWIMSSK